MMAVMNLNCGMADGRKMSIKNIYLMLLKSPNRDLVGKTLETKESGRIFSFAVSVCSMP